MATATTTETVIIRPTSTSTRPTATPLLRSEAKPDVSRLFRTKRAALRRYAGPEIPVSQSGASGSAGLAVLRDRSEPRLHVADRTARNGQDDSAVPSPDQVRSYGAHCVSVSNPVQFARVHAVPAGGNWHRERLAGFCPHARAVQSLPGAGSTGREALHRCHR